MPGIWSKARRLRLACGGKGIDAEAIRYDAGDPGTEKEVADFFENRYERLDILVNNAGMMRDEQPRSDTGANDLSRGSSRDVRYQFFRGGVFDPDPCCRLFASRRRGGSSTYPAC